jgi:hypothetical protein
MATLSTIHFVTGISLVMVIYPRDICSDTLTFGKLNSSRQWYNSSLSSLIFIFPLNIWRVNKLERSKSLLSKQINTTYVQTLTTGSLTTVQRILALPLSSNCRSLNQTSLRGPGFVTLRDNLAYYSCMLQMTADSDGHTLVYLLLRYRYIVSNGRY